MKKELVKIGDSELLVRMPFSGPYLDRRGDALHGIYRREHKKTCDCLIIENGQFIIKYKYPKIDQKFSSNMLNYTNLLLCGTWFPYRPDGSCMTIDEVDKIIFERVISGVKPMGFIKYKKEYRELADKMGFYTAVHKKHRISGYNLGIANPARIKDVFDLSSLRHDYRAYFYKMGEEIYEEMRLEIEELIAFLMQHSFKDILVDFDYTKAYKTPTEDLLRGLILGYPVETTISLIWRDMR